MKVTKATNRLTTSLQRVKKEFDSLPQQAFGVWLDNTPKDSGIARRNTTLTNNRIHANYPYATELDAGSSNQAPDGMSKPTSEWIKKRVKNIRK